MLAVTGLPFLFCFRSHSQTRPHLLTGRRRWSVYPRLWGAKKSGRLLWYVLWDFWTASSFPFVRARTLSESTLSPPAVLGMFSLEKRRQRGDLRAVFKYLKGCHTKEEGARSVLDHPRVLKLQQTRFRLNIRKYFLTVRAVRQWNQLHWEVVSAATLEALKRNIDNHLADILWFVFLHQAGGWTWWHYIVGPFQLHYVMILSSCSEL